MNAELIAILAVGVAVAGLVLNGQRANRREIGTLRTEIQTEIGTLRTEMQTEIGTLRAEVHREISTLRTEISREIADLRERMARLEGLLEGLREAISGRRDAA